MFITLWLQLLSLVEVGGWMVKALCWDKGNEKFKPHQWHCLPWLHSHVIMDAMLFGIVHFNILNVKFKSIEFLYKLLDACQKNFYGLE